MASTKKTRMAGIDVSAKTLHVAFDGDREGGEFANTPDGHKALLKVLTKGGALGRVVVEATSTYHLDLCLALDAHKRCEVMVANPRATRHFHMAQGIRAKTDKVDAVSLLEYLRRMPFVPWKRPEQHIIELRAGTRYVAQLIKQQTRLKNQLQAMQASEATAASWILTDLKEQLEQHMQRVEGAKARATAFAGQHPDVWSHVERIKQVEGIGVDTAVRLVAEFLVLDTTMTSKEITAWAGLDPRPRESGTSVRGRPSISKRGNSRVRAMLYMNALTVTRSKASLGDFYRRLKDRTPFPAIALTAVMRKLLVISWAIFRTRQAWDAERVRPHRGVSQAA